MRPSYRLAGLVVLLSAVPAVAQTELPPYPPDPTAVEVLTEPVEVRRPPWSVTAEIGVGWGGPYGNLVPPARLNATRPFLFPLPNAELDGFVSPRVTVGYEFAIIPGEIQATWQAFSGEGEAILLGYDPMAAMFLGVMDWARRNQQPNPIPVMLMRPTQAQNALLRSRLDVNLGDLAYSAPLWSVSGDGPVLRAKVGGRLGGFFTDDRATTLGYEQWVSNWFFGAGPLAGLRLDIPYGPSEDGRRPGVYLAVDGGVLFGEVQQKFRETDSWVRPHPWMSYREAVVTKDRAVEFLNAEIGIVTRGGPADRLRTTFGFRYSQFWNVGQVEGSSLDLQLFTVFVGAELRF